MLYFLLIVSIILTVRAASLTFDRRYSRNISERQWQWHVLMNPICYDCLQSVKVNVKWHVDETAELCLAYPYRRKISLSPAALLSSAWRHVTWRQNLTTRFMMISADDAATHPSCGRRRRCSWCGVSDAGCTCVTCPRRANDGHSRWPSACLLITHLWITPCSSRCDARDNPTDLRPMQYWTNSLISCVLAAANQGAALWVSSSLEIKLSWLVSLVVFSG